MIYDKKVITRQPYKFNYGGSKKLLEKSTFRSDTQSSPFQHVCTRSSHGCLFMKRGIFWDTLHEIFDVFSTRVNILVKFFVGFNSF